MRHKLSPRRLPIPALALALALILSACAGAAPTAAPTAVPTSPPATAVLATDTPAAVPTATETSVPSATVTATAAPTETSAPTSASSPTPHPAQGQITLSGLAWMPDYNMLLSFNFPGPVDAADYRVMLEEKEYRCEVLEQYPNRLYCYGAGAKVLTTAMVRVYPVGVQQPIYERSYWIPYFE